MAFGCTKTPNQSTTTVTSGETYRSNTQTTVPPAMQPAGPGGVGGGPAPGDMGGSGRVPEAWGSGTPTGSETSGFDNMGAGSYGTATMDGGRYEPIAPELARDGGR